MVDGEDSTGRGGGGSNDRQNSNDGNNDPGSNNAGDSNSGADDLGWRTGLPDDIKEHQSLAKFTDIEGLAKSYLHAETMIGRDKIPMPKTEEEWDQTYTRLGKPKTHEEYEVSVKEELPQSMKDSLGPVIPWFKETAHKLGLNRKQASELFSEYNNLMEHQLKEKDEYIKTEMEESISKLRSEYGQAYETKLHLANRAIDQFGGSELVELLKDSGLGRHPTMVRAFMQIGENIAEDLGLDKRGEPLLTPNEIQDQIGELMSKSAYTDEYDPAHKAAVKKVQGLMKILYPEPSKI